MFWCLVAAGIFGALAGWGWLRMRNADREAELERAWQARLDQANRDLEARAVRVKALEGERDSMALKIKAAEDEAARLRLRIDDLEVGTTRLESDGAEKARIIRNQQAELDAVRATLVAAERVRDTNVADLSASQAALASLRTTHATIEKAQGDSRASLVSSQRDGAGAIGRP